MINIGVGHEKIIDIPKEQMKLPPRFVGELIAEQKILLGVVPGKHPAHDVNPDLVRALVKLNRIPPAFVHRPAVFTEHRAVAQNIGKARPLLKNRRHGNHRVKPIFKLSGE